MRDLSLMALGVVAGVLITVAMLNTFTVEPTPRDCPPGMMRAELRSQAGEYGYIVFCVPEVR